jgi:coiled-coil-helix-coiled-coil-helix domain-containing protein 2
MLLKMNYCHQGNAISGMMGGGSSDHAAPAAAAPAQAAPAPYGAPQQSQGPCSWEVSQFLQCAQNQHDLTLCDGFNEALRQCKTSNSKTL